MNQLGSRGVHSIADRALAQSSIASDEEDPLVVFLQSPSSSRRRISFNSLFARPALYRIQPGHGRSPWLVAVLPRRAYRRQIKRHSSDSIPPLVGTTIVNAGLPHPVKLIHVPRPLGFSFFHLLAFRESLVASACRGPLLLQTGDWALPISEARCRRGLPKKQP